MLHTVIDLETTGLNRHRGAVLAAGYLTLDDKLENVIDSDILYFYQESFPDSDAKALELHGLTRSFLRQYTDDFSKNLKKLFKLVLKGSLIGHNIDQFDLPYMQEFLARNGYGDVEAFQTFDTMKIYKPVFGGNYHGARVSLTNLISELKIPRDGIEIMQKHYFKGKDIQTVAHDATYDVTATLIAFLEAKRREYV